MKESLEDLKAIIENKPEKASIIDIEDGVVDYLYVDEGADNGQKIKNCANGCDGAIEYSDGNIRSLSDIEEIIELREWQIEANKNYQSMLDAYLND